MYDEDKLTAWRLPAEWDSPPAATLADSARLCRRIAAGIGAEGFGLFFLAAQDEARRLAPVFDSELPAFSVLSRTLSARGAEAFARQAAGMAAPLWWRPHGTPPHLTAPARAWAEEVASPAPGTCGTGFPVFLDRVRSGLVVFCGPDMMLDEAQLCETHARCFALFGDVARQRAQECAETPPMSKREIECLRLTANGLTSDDIATTLGLSVHTANQYLTNSTHKLNAVNRIHAVAKALRGGLID